MVDPLAPPHVAPVRARPRSTLALAARATALGLLPALGILAVVLASGTLTPAQPPACWAGLALAATTTALGNVVLAACLLDPRPSSGQRLARAMFADFAVHLGVGGGAVVALFSMGTKFLAAATFALAFAAAVVVMRVAGAVALSRSTSAGVARGGERERDPSQRS
jgi:hypothetical protein